MKMLMKMPPSDERSVGDDDGDDFPLREGSFTGRIVLPELQIGSAQVPPRGGGETTKKLPNDFFWNETLHIAKEGGQWAVREPTSLPSATRGVAVAGLVAPWQPPSGTSFAQYFLYNPKKIHVTFQGIWRCAEQWTKICSFSSPKFQLPEFSLFK